MAYVSYPQDALVQTMDCTKTLPYLKRNPGGGGATPSPDKIDNVYPQPEPSPGLEFDDQNYVVESWLDKKASSFSGGTGTKDDPYQISSPAELAYCYTAERQSLLRSRYAVLTNDIILNDGFFDESGTYHDGGDGILNECFAIWFENGTFDGQGHTIYGLYNEPLFKYIQNSTVKNLIIKNFCSNGSSSLGPTSAATVENVTVYGKLFASNHNQVGGLFSFEYGGSTIKNCKSYVDIECTGYYVGGIIGDGRASNYINCENHGKVSGRYIGGIMGRSTGSNFAVIDSCVNTGEICTAGDAVGGGIAGSVKAVITNCVNSGNFFASSSLAGICSILEDGEIRDCKNFGNVFNGVINNLRENAKVFNCENAFEGNCTNGLVKTCSGKIYRCVNKSNATYGLANIVSETGGIYECESLGDSIYYIANKINAGGEVKNCHFKGESLQAVGTNNGSLINIVYESSSNKEYYGTDFSKFFITWKDQRIGLIAIESVGLYRGKLTEAYLIKKEFTKVA